MSRKFWTCVGTVTSVALAIVVAPYLQGFRTETRLKDAVRSTHRLLYPVVETEIKSYQRGWFSAQIKAIVRIRIGEITEPFTASFEVVHGPLPLLEIARGKAPFELIGARIDGHLGIEPLDERTSQITRAKQGNPIDVQAVIGLGGSARVKVALTKVDQPARAIGWNGGFANLSTSGDFSRVTSEAKLWNFSFRDVGGERALKIGLLRVNARPEAKTNQPVVEVRLDSLRANKRNWQAEVDEALAQLTHKMGPKGASESKASVTVKMADVKYQDYIGVNSRWKLSGVTATGETTFGDKKATLKGQCRIKEMNTAKTGYGSIDSSWTITFEDTGAPSDLRQAWTMLFVSKDKRKEQGKSPSASTQPSSPVVPYQRQVEMVTKIKRAGQLSQIDMQSVQYEREPTTTANYAYQPPDNQNTALLRLDMDKALFDDALFEFAELLAYRTAYFEQDFTIDKATIIDGLFRGRGLGLNQFFQKEPSRYRSTIQWKEGVVKANGNPVGIFEWMKQLSAWETAVHPRLSLRVEKLESRGSLDQAQVTTAVQAVAKNLANCIWQSRAKASAPAIREEVKTAWEIDTKGKARVTKIAFSAKENATAKSCLQNVLENDTSYPRSSDTTAASLVIRYELTTK
jgi:hypothetical protein